MVYFSCGNCGDTLKKAQVSSHSCRRAKFACLDCKKEFTLLESAGHIQCISEAEKYSGGTFKPKPGAKKTQNDAEEWKSLLLAALIKTRMTKSVKNELQLVIKKAVLPRNLEKFKHFLKSNNGMLQKTKNLFTQVFNVASKALKKEKKGTTTTKAVEGKKHSEKGTDDTATVQKSENAGGKKRKLEEDMDASEKLVAPETSKKSRRRKRAKKECENDVAEIKLGKPGVVTGEKRRKSKQNRGNGNENLTETLKETHLNTIGGSAEPKSFPTSKNSRKRQRKADEAKTATRRVNKKKRELLARIKKLDGSVVNEMELETSTPDGMPANTKASTHVGKGQSDEKIKTISKNFKLGGVVKSILERAEGHQLPIKKLSKKVLAEYLATNDGTKQMPKEQLEAKLLKTLTKNPTLKYLKDKVTLVQKSE